MRINIEIHIKYKSENYCNIKKNDKNDSKYSS